MTSSVNPVKCAHALELLAALEKMKNDERHCDFTIKVGNESFRVHRTVLSACSEYFSAMLSHDMKEAREGVVDMQDEEADAVKHCVGFMYTGEASITMENVQSVLKASHLMQLSGLTKLCFDFLLNEMKVDNCLSIKALAERYNDETLEKAVDKLAIENLATVMKSDVFVYLTLAQISFYLKETAAQQEIVWEAILKWIKHNEDDKKQYLVNLLKAAKLQSFSFQFLLSKVWSESLVRNSMVCQDFVAQILLSNPHDVRGNIDEENCFVLNRIVQTVQTAKRNEVKKEVILYMVKNFEKISTKKDFFDLSDSDILALFQRSELEHTLENVKWNAALKWTKKYSNRKNLFRDLLQTIKFERFSKTFFQGTVLTEPLVKESHDCKDYLLDILCTQSFKDSSLIAVADKDKGEINLFGVSSKEWKLHSKFPKTEVCFVTNLNGDLYMLHGNCLLLYSRDNEWTNVRKLELRKEAICLLSFKKKLCVFCSFCSYFVIFDPSDQTHKSIASSNTFDEPTSFVALDDYIYVMSRIRLFGRFSPPDGSYECLPSPNQERGRASAVALNGFVYVLGGWRQETSVEFFNPATFTWTVVASMIRPRNMFSACVIDGMIYAIGGEAPDEETNERKKIDSIEVYDPVKNSWEMVAEMKKLHGYVSACVL